MAASRKKTGRKASSKKNDDTKPANGSAASSGNGKPKSAIQQFQATLYSPGMRDQIALALPKHVDPERMLRIILTSVRRTPALLKCSRESVFGSIMQAAQLGLEPDDVLGHCYLLPYGNECQLILGYKGLIELARRSGLVANVRAHVVKTGDYFKYALGLKPTLEHVPYEMLEWEDEAKQRVAMNVLGDSNAKVGELRAAYAIVDLKDGTKVFEVVTNEYITKIKGASQSASSKHSPWQKWPEPMWRKTAIKQALKYVPLSPEDRLTKALANDEQAYLWKGGRDIVPALVAQATDDDGDGGELEPAAPKTKLDQFVDEQREAKGQSADDEKPPAPPADDRGLFQGGEPEDGELASV